MNNYVAVNAEYLISTDKALLNMGVIHQFLKEESYWAQNRTKEQTELAIEHSICFGLYKENQLIGFARVVTDYTVFGYIGDVFILSPFRKKGLSKWMMEVILKHPELQTLRRWILATKDAHGLYEQFGFHSLVYPERWMERPAADAYPSN